MRHGEMTWSTASVKAENAFDYWSGVVNESIMPLRIDSSMRQSFSAALIQRSFGPALVSFVSASPQEDVWRTSTEITKQRALGFHLLQLRRGQMTFRQQGRVAALLKGDCVLLNADEPSHWSFPEHTDSVALQVSRSWLQTWLPSPEDAAAVAISGAGGWGGVLCAALANLTPGDLDSLPLPGHTVADQLGALLALALGVQRDDSSTTHQRALLKRLCGTIEQRCHDQNFDPTALANEHGLSKRYVHTLFAAKNTCFGNELRLCRLKKAHRLLSDVRFQTLGTSEIAWRCGFTSPSHFARCFRNQFGFGPSAFRKTALRVRD